jgi:hypothetical protein
VPRRYPRASIIRVTLTPPMAPSNFWSYFHPPSSRDFPNGRSVNQVISHTLKLSQVANLVIFTSLLECILAPNIL